MYRPGRLISWRRCSVRSGTCDSGTRDHCPWWAHRRLWPCDHRPSGRVAAGVTNSFRGPCRGPHAIAGPGAVKVRSWAWMHGTFGSSNGADVDHRSVGRPPVVVWIDGTLRLGPGLRPGGIGVAIMWPLGSAVMVPRKACPVFTMLHHVDGAVAVVVRRPWHGSCHKGILRRCVDAVVVPTVCGTYVLELPARRHPGLRNPLPFRVIPVPAALYPEGIATLDRRSKGRVSAHLDASRGASDDLGVAAARDRGGRRMAVAGHSAGGDKKERDCSVVHLHLGSIDSAGSGTLSVAKDRGPRPKDQSALQMDGKKPSTAKFPVSTIPPIRA